MWTHDLDGNHVGSSCRHCLVFCFTSSGHYRIMNFLGSGNDGEGLHHYQMYVKDKIMWEMVGKQYGSTVLLPLYSVISACDSSLYTHCDSNSAKHYSESVLPFTMKTLSSMITVPSNNE